jgi:hypothetical protein
VSAARHNRGRARTPGRSPVSSAQALMDRVQAHDGGACLRPRTRGAQKSTQLHAAAHFALDELSRARATL